MSDLLKEDDEFIYLRQYVHHDSEEYSDWMCTPDMQYCPDPKWDERLIMAADGACYEIEVKFKVNKKTFEVTYDEITP